MKRTKDGGAILETSEGDLKLTKKEFERSRATRNLIRTTACLGIFLLDYFLLHEYMLTVGVICLTIGWRIQAGW